MHTGPRSSAEQILKILPVLLYALLMGMGMFSVLAAVVGPGRAGSPGSPGGGASGGGVPGAGPAGGAPLQAESLLLIMAVLGVVAVVVYVAMGRVAVAQATRAYEAAAGTTGGVAGGSEPGRDAVAQVLMTTTILRAAFSEGVGLLGAVTVFLTGNLLGLAGVALAAALIGGLLSVRSRYESLLRQASGERFGM